VVKYYRSIDGRVGLYAMVLGWFRMDFTGYLERRLAAGVVLGGVCLSVCLLCHGSHMGSEQVTQGGC
jgi:hypothetical protein